MYPRSPNNANGGGLFWPKYRKETKQYYDIKYPSRIITLHNANGNIFWNQQLQDLIKHYYLRTSTSTQATKITDGIDSNEGQLSFYGIIIIILSCIAVITTTGLLIFVRKIRHRTTTIVYK